MKRMHEAAVSGLTAFALCIALMLINLMPVNAHAGAAAMFTDKRHERAARLLREGEFEQAEQLFREWLAKHPRDEAARLGLSFALLKQRLYQEAFDAAARVIAIDPLSARAHALLGAALLGSGDFRLSVEEFRTALSFKENEALAIAGLAMVSFYENRMAESLEGLRRASYIDASEPDYFYHLGQVAARYERYAEAADAYERFLRIAPRTDADRRARIKGLIDFLRYLGTQRDLLHAGGASRTTIPFTLVNSRPILEVRINGSDEPLRFVIDTGAGMCVVSDVAAKRIGLRPVARGGMARAVGASGKFEIVYGFLQSLQFGDAKVERVPVYIRAFAAQQEPVDGYIGLSIFSKFLSVIDYEKRHLTLVRNSERTPVEESAPLAPGSAELQIRTTSSGFWSGEIQLEGVSKPLNFIVDTGASITVVSEDLAAREDMERFLQPLRIRVYGAAGVTDEVKTLLLPRMQMGTLARRNIPAAILDLDAINETSGFEQTGILGGNVLKHYRVTFDFQRAVVRLDPLDQKAHEQPPQVMPVIVNQP